MGYKNDVKLALLFIAMGLILGGISGMTQNPPPNQAEGWTSTDVMWNGLTAIVPDQNNDSINDIIKIYGATEFNETQESQIYFNRSTGIQLIDGASGKLLRQEKFSTMYYLQDWNGQPTVYFNGSIILHAVLYKNLTRDDWVRGSVAADYYDYNNMHLIKIDLKTLQITKILNLTGDGYENPDVFNVTNYLQTGWYDPEWYFIKNTGFSVPGSGGSYTNDVILYKTRFNPANNFSMNLYHFIDPNTFERISTIDNQFPVEIDPLIKGNSLNIQFLPARGPVGELDRYKYTPYFTWRYFSSQDYQVKSALNVSMTTMDNLQNYTSCEMNCLFNETLGLRYPNQNFQFDAVLTMKNKTTPNGVVFHQYASTQERVNPYRGLYYENQKYMWATGEKLSFTDASRIDIFKFEIGSKPLVGAVQRTFSEESYLESWNAPETWGGHAGLTTVLVIPIKYENNQNSPTGVAMVRSEFKLSNITSQSGLIFPLLDFAVVFVNQSVTTGDVINGEEFHDWDGTWGNGWFNITNNFEFARNNFFIPIDFDVDGDNCTDIALPGHLGVPTILDTATQYVNGPFAVAHQNVSNGVRQFTSYYLGFYQKMIFRSDINNDKIDDVVIDGRITMRSHEVAVSEDNWLKIQLNTRDTRIFFFVGVAMIVCAIFLIVKAITIKSPESIKFGKNKILILFVILSIIFVFWLFMTIEEIIQFSQKANETQIGTTEKAISLANMIKMGGIAMFLFLTVWPASVGIYILLTPISSDSVVGLNEIMLAKKAGLKAVVKKQALDENAAIKDTDLRYKVIVIPPFGKKIETKALINRALSVLFLAVSIGLLVFENVTTYLVPIKDLSTVTSFTDSAFIEYINVLFLYLIIPGILSVPLFFWLIPTSWLLDDAGVLFYIKPVRSRDTEDIESMAEWFSSYLKGFLGISAIYSYGKFIWESPVFALQPILPKEISGTIMVFVFGFLLLSGLALGLLLTAIHEITMPYSVTRLYGRLRNRKVDVSMKELQINDKGQLSDEAVVHGFLGIKNVDNNAPPAPEPSSFNSNFEFKPPQ